MNVGNSHHQYPHSALGTVYHTRRDMDQAPRSHRVYLTVQGHRPFPLEYVIQLGALAVVVFTGAIDIDRVHPGGDTLVLATDQQMSPSTGAPFRGAFTFVADQGLRGIGIRWRGITPSGKRDSNWNPADRTAGCCGGRRAFPFAPGQSS